MKSRIESIYTRHRFASSIVLVLFSFVFFSTGLVLVNGETLEPNDSHVVSLYVDGREYDVPTRAKTVRELIERSKIVVSEYDSVEPGLDAEIGVNAFKVRVVRARPYTVKDGTKQLSALSAHTSARLIAESAGLTLKPADRVEFAPIERTSFTEIGRVVEIIRSKQITLSLYGSAQTVNTNVLTVRDLFTELAISPAFGDEISPSTDTLLEDGGYVYINRNGIKVISEDIAVDPPVEYVQDNGLTMGSSVTRDPGKPGKKVVTYEITTENDVEVSRREISSTVVEQPVTKVVARGRAAGQIGAEREQIMELAGIPQSEYAAVNYIIGQESGWCATKWQGQYGRCPDYYEELYDTSSSRVGYGLCQSTPAIKMASIAPDWQTNAAAQLKWCYNYMLGYGSATAAADFKQCLGQCYSPRTRSTVTKQTTWF